MVESYQAFDVALWLTWPSLFSEYVALVPAASAFTAVVSVMRSYGVYSVTHATASTCDGSLVCRAFGVKLAVCEGEVLEL